MKIETEYNIGETVYLIERELCIDFGHNPILSKKIKGIEVDEELNVTYKLDNIDDYFRFFKTYKEAYEKIEYCLRRRWERDITRKESELLAIKQAEKELWTYTSKKTT